MKQTALLIEKKLEDAGIVGGAIRVFPLDELKGGDLVWEHKKILLDWNAMNAIEQSDTLRTLSIRDQPFVAQEEKYRYKKSLWFFVMQSA